MAGVVGDHLSRDELLALVRKLQQRIEQLERELTAARKNSSNSSKPPSSDIVKPPRDDDSGRSDDDSAGSGGGSAGSGGGSAGSGGGSAGSGGGAAPRRKIGGQPGHPKHARAPFPPQQADRVHTHTLAACPDCGGRLTHWPEQRRVVQQVEFVAAPVRIDEHRAEAYGCRRCGRTHHAPLPPAVQAGDMGVLISHDGTW